MRIASLFAVVALAVAFEASFVLAQQRPRVPDFANKPWKVTAPEGAPAGSLYIFMSNGTLLQTSCVEVYRLSSWRMDGQKLIITEDPNTRIEGEVQQPDASTLRVRLKLRSGWDPWKTLRLAKPPDVCPDLPR
jgi:hypothetical protein